MKYIRRIKESALRKILPFENRPLPIGELERIVDWSLLDSECVLKNELSFIIVITMIKTKIYFILKVKKSFPLKQGSEPGGRATWCRGHTRCVYRGTKSKVL
jgi:hypothetical protein